MLQRILFSFTNFLFSKTHREDDKMWPKKNIVGKQELEVKVGDYHISFEVCLLPFSFPSSCSVSVLIVCLVDMGN